ncbi:conserved hypothetical protein [Ricinus communis]|uniref:Uncharacterized protein n=1 Tax=Ricinus communis TaxID=3988 RepID=B9T8U6_RICCO|nr:conserved hypothetical protein [Ricinus communis]
MVCFRHHQAIAAVTLRSLAAAGRLSPQVALRRLGCLIAASSRHDYRGAMTASQVRADHARQAPCTNAKQKKPTRRIRDGSVYIHSRH